MLSHVPWPNVFLSSNFSFISIIRRVQCHLKQVRLDARIQTVVIPHIGAPHSREVIKTYLFNKSFASNFNFTMGKQVFGKMTLNALLFVLPLSVSLVGPLTSGAPSEHSLERGEIITSTFTKSFRCGTISMWHLPLSI